MRLFTIVLIVVSAVFEAAFWLVCILTAFVVVGLYLEIMS